MADKKIVKGFYFQFGLTCKLTCRHGASPKGVAEWRSGEANGSAYVNITSNIVFLTMEIKKA